MNIKKIFQFISTSMGMALLLMVISVTAQAQINLNGAGATFPYPLYSKWFYEYSKIKPDYKFNYQSIGSGGGIRQITAKTVDFGASDAPMADTEIAGLGAEILHIPTVLGSVVLSFNVPEISGEFKLTGDVVAEIFLGKITKWNDPKLAALNPGLVLPSKDILVVYRSDGSGTTYVFTDYLAKVSPAWATQVGREKSVKWPIGIGAKGNEGVSGMLKQTPYSIGYLEFGYAVQNKLNMAALKNKAGQFVKPSVESVTAAADAVQSMPADYRVSITDSSVATAYPISSLTYLLIYKKQTDANKGKALTEFLNWALNQGQNYAKGLYYSPLPEALRQKVLKTVSQISS